MTRLYTDLARVYHEMYQSLFDYPREFRHYHALLQKHGCRRILEIACGTGNLAPYFVRAGYDYTGLDLSEEMLAIARTVAPEVRFLRGDMRKFTNRRKFDAALITGRSFCYMTSNEDVTNAVKCIHRALAPGGILMFSNFNAHVIFRNFRKRHVHRATFEGRKYTRYSTTSPNPAGGWTWNWDARYIIVENGRKCVIDDTSVMRAFTRDELLLFLALAKFEPVSVRKRDADITIVARRL